MGQIKIIELKNVISIFFRSECFKVEWRCQRIESVNQRTDQLNLHNLNNKDLKNDQTKQNKNPTEHEGPVRKQQIVIMGFTDVSGQERSGTERVFREIMTINFPNLEKDTSLEIQEAEQTLSKINPKSFKQRTPHKLQRTKRKL